MDMILGANIWSDDNPEVFGERLRFDDLKNIGQDELLLCDEEAADAPYCGTVVRI